VAVNHLVGQDLAQVIKSMVHAVLEYLKTIARWQKAKAEQWWFRYAR
jgi:hypothetical protein